MRDWLALPEPDGCDLNEILLVRIQTGRLQIVDHKISAARAHCGFIGTAFFASHLDLTFLIRKPKVSFRLLRNNRFGFLNLGQSYFR